MYVTNGLRNDNKNSIDAIYLDFQKAFDSVPHQRLLLKLKGYGIQGRLLKWIENFLKDRKQSIQVDGASSDWADVTSGIPQGSVLGPTLFLIYINDLPDVVHSFVKLFADDAKLYAVVNTANDASIVQQDLTRVDKWSDVWQIKFNYNKCNHMHLGKHRNFSKYFMSVNGEQTEINQVPEQKDLGVIIDDKLNFKPHIQAMVKKANRNLGIIKRTFSYLDKTILLNLYKSIVRPNLEYASTVWSVIYKKDSISIENVQRRATRLVQNIRHLNYTDRMKELGLPSLQYRRSRADLIEVFKIFNGIDKCDKDQ